MEGLYKTILKIITFSISMIYDIAIIGGGPAGIACAIYAAAREMKTILFEPAAMGGTVNEAMEILNYPSAGKIEGEELAKRFAEHLMLFPKVEIKKRMVERISKNGDLFEIRNGGGEVISSKTVVVATGAKHRALNLPNEEKFAGRGVSYCTTCDAPFFKDKVVAVVGGGDSALKSAIYLSEIAKETIIIHRRDEFRGEKIWQEKIDEKGVKKELNKVVVELKGENKLEAVVVEDVKTKERKEIKVDGLFINIGNTPISELVENMGVEMDERKFIKADKWSRTNIPGLYAAGDVTGKGMQIVVAASDGALAALDAYLYIKQKFPEKS